MTDTNGFDEFKRLYDYRLDQADSQHAEVLEKIDDLATRIAAVDVKVGKHQAWWGALGAGVVVGLTYAIPLLIGGCYAG